MGDETPWTVDQWRDWLIEESAPYGLEQDCNGGSCWDRTSEPPQCECGALPTELTTLFYTENYTAHV